MDLDDGYHDQETKVRLNREDHEAFLLLASRTGVKRAALMRAVLRDWLSRTSEESVPALTKNGRRV
jgi:hypothetical protein